MSETQKTKQTLSENLTFLAEKFLRVFEIQNSNIDKFDQKISWFLLFQSAILVWFLEKSVPLSIVLITSIVFNILAVFPRNFRTPFDPNKIVNRFWNDGLAIADAQAHMVVEIKEAIKNNKLKLSDKAFYARLVKCSAKYSRKSASTT